MRTLDQIISSLPQARRAKIASRAQQLIAEEVALHHLRQARELTQQRMAELLHIKQTSVSKIETRSDMLLSTLRSYILAMGGSLRLVAEFPDAVVELSSIGETPDARIEKEIKEKTKRRRPHLVHAE